MEEEAGTVKPTQASPQGLCFANRAHRAVVNIDPGATSKTFTTQGPTAIVTSRDADMAKHTNTQCSEPATSVHAPVQVASKPSAATQGPIQIVSKPITTAQASVEVASTPIAEVQGPSQAASSASPGKPQSDPTSARDC
jgi:hypothetical protein